MNQIIKHAEQTAGKTIVERNRSHEEEARSVIQRVENARGLLVQASKSIEGLKDLLGVSKAIEVYARTKQAGEEAQRAANALTIDVQASLGWLLQQLEKHNGGRPRETGTKMEPVIDAPKKLAEIGIDKKLSANAQAIAVLQTADPITFERIRTGEITLAKARLEKKTARVHAEIKQQMEAIERGEVIKPSGVYDVIAIDPPWDYGDEYDAAGRRGAAPYPTMTLAEIAAMEIPSAENCVVFLWTTHRFLPDAFSLIKKWNFEYSHCFVWDKEIIGMGSRLRLQCEFCLMATKGKPEFLAKDVRDIIREKRREHSRKPDAFYDLIPRLVKGDRRVELFSREKRAGWAQLGNDVAKFEAEGI